MKRWPAKDADETADFGLDWSARLAGDSIAQSQWIVPDDLIAGSSYHDGSLAIVWLSGGTNGKSYAILNRVITQNGRHYDQSVKIAIRSK